MSKEYSVTEALPNNGEKVLCFGHHTYCCEEDMDEKPDWHEATFELKVHEYKLKNTVPLDPEESILEYYKASESWDCGPEFMDGRVIGVTKWKRL